MDTRYEQDNRSIFLSPEEEIKYIDEAENYSYRQVSNQSYDIEHEITERYLFD